MDVLEKTGIPAKYVSKRSTARGTLIFESRKTQTVVQGVDFSRESYLRDGLVLVKGSFDAMSDRQGLILSEPTARKLDVEIGDRLLFQLTTLTGQQNVGEMVLVAITPDNGLLSGFSVVREPLLHERAAGHGQTRSTRTSASTCRRSPAWTATRTSSPRSSRPGRT